MVAYWDTSAVAPLLILEPEIELRQGQLLAIAEMVTWWGTRTQTISALCRRKRESEITQLVYDQANARLERLAAQWSEVAPSELLRRRSERLLRVHSLRAADALQLASALIAAGEAPEGAEFYTSDKRLAAAAGAEGFVVR